MNRSHAGLLALLVLVLAKTSFAQPRFYLAYGDAATVDLAKWSGHDPNAALGKEIPRGKSFVIPSKGSSFKVQLWWEIGPKGGTQTIGGVPITNAANAVVAFDTGTWHSEEANVPTDKKLTGVTSADLNFGNAIPGHNNVTGAAFIGTTTPVSAPKWTHVDTPTHYNGTSKGPFGFLLGFTTAPVGAGPIGNVLDVSPGLAATRLLDLTLMNADIAPGEIYGDVASENGILLPLGAKGPVGNYFVNHPVEDGRQLADAKYAVQAVPVPEPTSLLAIGLAGLILARRRKAQA